MENIHLDPDKPPTIDLAKLAKDRRNRGARTTTALMTDRLNTNSSSAATNQTFGLMSPPSSQTNQMDLDIDIPLPIIDPARMLISPPPEETLRHGGRLSVSHGRSNSATTTPQVSTAAPVKRKRPVASTAPHSNPPDPGPTTRISTTTTTAPDFPPQTEATPNPKPRKHPKRHVRTLSTRSLDSPTLACFPSIATSQRCATPTKRKSTSPTKRMLLQSPHLTNPDADFIPPVPSLTSSADRRALLSARGRRSATPIPPYEPPREVFTPPREVIVTPTISKSSKRKSVGGRSINLKAKEGGGTADKAKGKRKTLKVFIPSVKNEPPDVDLNAPMPPASPSDDPLLLSGPVVPPSSVLRRAATRAEDATPVRPRTSTVEKETSGKGLEMRSMSPMQDDEEGVKGPGYFDWGLNMHEVDGSTDFSMDLDDEGVTLPLPLFDLHDLPSSNGGWSDSDDEDLRGKVNKAGEVHGEGEGEGEYTGRWRMMRVRTKEDPPSSATRGRMDAWGRPISPFPGSARRSCASGDDGERWTVGRLDLLGGVGEDDNADGRSFSGEVESDHGNVSAEAEVSSATFDLREERAGVREMSVEEDQDDEEEEEEVREMSIERDDEEEEREMSVEQDQLENEEEEEVREMSIERDDEEEERAEREMSVEQDELENEEEEETVIDRELSREPDSDEDEAGGDPAKDARALPSDQRAASSHGAEAWQVQPEPIRRVSSPVVGSPVRDSSSFAMDLPPQASTSFDLRSAPHTSTSHRRATINCSGVDEDMLGVANELEGDSSDGEDSDGVDEGVVKITSGDPRAAARAAAILKQHDYDCFTKIFLKQRRNSHSNADSMARGARRKDVSASGVTKSTQKKRRTTLGGVIGDRVIIPGSPAMTLPELLHDAEVELENDSGLLSAKGMHSKMDEGDLFKTPLPARYMERISLSGLSREVTEREWTRENWKQLDACFTDERLEVGARLGLGEEVLAGVDAVLVEDVVSRFTELMAGDGVHKFGMPWTHDSLLQRAQALQNKQRSGNVAPPTTPYSPTLFATTRRPMIDVPDFTPLGRLAHLPRKQRPMLPPPVLDAPFKDIPPERPQRLPPSLLAPRYSHLLEEAISVSQQGFNAEVPGSTSLDNSISTETETAPSTPVKLLVNDTTTLQTSSSAHPPPSIGKRVKGFFFSYLPTLSKTALPPNGKSQPPRPGLPLPPREVLEKHRGPISTPIRPPAPKPKHPKELVHLQPAPQQQQKTSLIPRATKPQRLVELHPLPSPISSQPTAISRGRRSSGGSVKDLVRTFEELEGSGACKGEPIKHAELKRVRSNGDWKKGSENGHKPTWRP